MKKGNGPQQAFHWAALNCTPGHILPVRAYRLYVSMCVCLGMCMMAACEQQLWRTGGYIWPWPLCVCVDGGVKKKKGSCRRRASESESSRNGAISGVKKASERLPVCAAGPQPSGHSPPSFPPSPLLSSPLLFLSSPLPTGVLFMADPFHLSVCYTRSPQYMLMR